MIDYHVHSERSGDAVSSIRDTCRVAISRGLKELCFTEHVDFEPTDYCFGGYDHELYLRQVEEAREEFGDRIAIGFGIEVDYQAKYHSRIVDFLDGRQFDFVIGSAHYVGGVILEDHEAYFPGKTAEEAYAPYFENVLAMVQTGLFDCLAHIDLCKRYGVRYLGPFDWQAFAEPIDAVLRAVIRRGMSLEVNTSGLRQSPRECYPTDGILGCYRSLGGKNITVGSDAHNAGDVGAGVVAALRMAQNAGLANVDIFRARQREEISIETLLPRCPSGDC